MTLLTCEKWLKISKERNDQAGIKLWEARIARKYSKPVEEVTEEIKIDKKPKR
jgi:hypothetical protein